MTMALKKKKVPKRNPAKRKVVKHKRKPAKKKVVPKRKPAKKKLRKKSSKRVKNEDFMFPNDNSVIYQGKCVGFLHRELVLNKRSGEYETDIGKVCFRPVAGCPVTSEHVEKALAYFIDRMEEANDESDCVFCTEIQKDFLSGMARW